MAAEQPQRIARDIALRYAKVLRRELSLKGLYVYGSYARGSQNADSDIDIAVVADGLSGDAVDDTWRLMKLRRSIDTRIEPHPFLPCDFTEDNPIAAEVLRTGIRIV